MTTAVSNNTYAQAGSEGKLKKFSEDKFSSIHRLSPKRQMDGLRTFPFFSFFTKEQRLCFQECETMASWEVLEETSTLTTILKIVS